jgi:hypothetical protein
MPTSLKSVPLYLIHKAQLSEKDNELFEDSEGKLNILFYITP